MLHVFLNKTDFEQDYASEILRNYLTPESRIGVIPMFDDEGLVSETMQWRNKFSIESEYYDDVMRPLGHYGIRKKNVSFYDGSAEDILSFSTSKDIVLLIGEDADSCLRYAWDYGLEELFYEFSGLILCVGCVGGILGDSYLSIQYDGSWLEKEGLGLYQGLVLDIPYEEDRTHVERIIRLIETNYDEVVVVPRQGGVLIQDQIVEPFGSAFFANDSDLDELYHILEVLE